MKKARMGRGVPPKRIEEVQKKGTREVDSGNHLEADTIPSLCKVA
jgi:hypothetical protein